MGVFDFRTVSSSGNTFLIDDLVQWTTTSAFAVSFSTRSPRRRLSPATSARSRPSMAGSMSTPPTILKPGRAAICARMAAPIGPRPTCSTRMSDMRELSYRSSHVGELVTDAPHREQISRVSRIGFDAPAQPLDERVDAAHGDERIAAPDFRKKRLAAEDDAGVRREKMQQTEFLIGELDILAVRAHA